MSLSSKMLSGSFWTFLEVILIKGGTFVSTVILAKWLGPNTFGLIGMISVFIAIGAVLVDSGMTASLIRTKNISEKDYTTVFYINLLFSIIIYFIFFLLSPVIADFFDQPELNNLVRVYCLIFIIQAFSSVQLTILNREMKFKKITMLNLPSTVISIILAMLFAYWGWGVYSIVYMYLIKQIMLSISLWVTSDWKPSLYFSSVKFKRHFNFGYKLTLSSLLNASFSNLYNVVIGKFYPLNILGQYERASYYKEYPISILTSIINKVTYPLMSSIQDNIERVSAVYRKLLNSTFFLTAPLMLGLGAIALPLVKLTLGNEWVLTAKYFEILCISSIFYPIHVFNINILKVRGRSDLFLKLEVYKKLLLVIMLLIMFPFGIEGLVWSSVLSSFLSLGINSYYSKQMINFTLWQQLRSMIPVFLLSITMALLMKLLVGMMEDYNLWIQIALPIVAGLLYFSVMSILFRLEAIGYLWQLIKK